MPTLPPKMVQAWGPLRHVSLSHVWQNAQVLLMGSCPQPQVCELSDLPCARWAWPNTKSSIATTGCSEKR